jgi:hypothetical protein
MSGRPMNTVAATLFSDGECQKTIGAMGYRVSDEGRDHVQDLSGQSGAPPSHACDVAG